MAEGGKDNYNNNETVSIYPIINTEQTRGPRDQKILLSNFYRLARVNNGDIFANFSNPLIPQSQWYDRDGNGPFYVFR